MVSTHFHEFFKLIWDYISFLGHTFWCTYTRRGRADKNQVKFHTSKNGWWMNRSFFAINSFRWISRRPMSFTYNCVLWYRDIVPWNSLVTDNEMLGRNNFFDGLIFNLWWSKPLKKVLNNISVTLKIVMTSSDGWIQQTTLPPLSLITVKYIRCSWLTLSDIIALQPASQSTYLLITFVQ